MALTFYPQFIAQHGHQRQQFTRKHRLFQHFGAGHLDPPDALLLRHHCFDRLQFCATVTSQPEFLFGVRRLDAVSVERQNRVLRLTLDLEILADGDFVACAPAAIGSGDRLGLGIGRLERAIRHRGFDVTPFGVATIGLGRIRVKASGARVDHAPNADVLLACRAVDLDRVAAQPAKASARRHVDGGVIRLTGARCIFDVAEHAAKHFGGLRVTLGIHGYDIYAGIRLPGIIDNLLDKLVRPVQRQGCATRAVQQVIAAPLLRRCRVAESQILLDALMLRPKGFFGLLDPLLCALKQPVFLRHQEPIHEPFGSSIDIVRFFPWSFVKRSATIHR